MSLCTPWITGDDVLACCSVESTSGAQFDLAAEQASDLLFELSGRLFPGECGPRTVRPPCLPCACGYQILSRGHIVGPWDWGYPDYGWGLCETCFVACSPSRIKLTGYPVRAVSEVLIDGVALASDDYAIYRDRYLTRLDGGRWPIGQDLTLPDDEEGTFSITYTYGADPPEMGIAAAGQLGCEIYNACAGQDCALPTGTTRVTRQGVTVEKLAFTSWGFTPTSRLRAGRPAGWNTGLPLVDAFLNAYNRSGHLRRPTFYAPGKRQYAQGFG